jgi:hypothetical protein
MVAGERTSLPGVFHDRVSNLYGGWSVYHGPRYFGIFHVHTLGKYGQEDFFQGVFQDFGRFLATVEP